MLDVKPSDGWVAVQQAFRRKAQRYHPDRAGGNPTIEKIASRRFEELNESFEEIRRFYRIFGDLPPLGLNETASSPRPHSVVNDAPRPAVPETNVPSRKISLHWAIPLGTIILFVVAAILGLTIL